MGLDELLLEVPDQLERQYLEEAVKCYHIEAYRAAVILSWIVTARNLEKKLEQLAWEDGETERYWVGIEKKKKEERSFEEDLLDACQTLGILDDQEAKELKHLRDTRNWCAHPTNYEPTAEKVRHCLRSTVEYALSRPVVRGFVYIRSLAEERVKDRLFLPSRDPDAVDRHVNEMLEKLRTDLHTRLAKQMVHTYQDPGATAMTRENIGLFLNSMVRQSPPEQLQGLTQAIEPLMDADLRTGAVILSSRPESFDHLSTLVRDRLTAFVIEEVTADAAPDKLVIRALEVIVGSRSLDNAQLQQMGTSLRMHIYDLYPELENKDAPFFADVLLERLEWDFAKLDSGDSGTDFNRANPAAKFVRGIGLHSFDSQPPESRKRLADAIVAAACENAWDVISIFLFQIAEIEDEWLQLLLDGLAHRLSKEGFFRNAKVLTSPLTEWVLDRGNDLTPMWKNLLQQALHEHQRLSLQMDGPHQSIGWCSSRSEKFITELDRAFDQVARALRERGYDDGLAVGFVDYLRAVYPRFFVEETEATQGFIGNASGLIQ